MSHLAVAGVPEQLCGCTAVCVCGGVPVWLCSVQPCLDSLLRCRVVLLHSYTEAMRIAIRSGALRTLDRDLDVNQCSGSCTDTRRVIALALDFMQRVTENPLIEWEPWVGAFLSRYISKTFPLSSDSAAYNASKNGLSSTTLIQGIVLPPDAWTTQTGRQRATVTVATANPQDGIDQVPCTSRAPRCIVC